MLLLLVFYRIHIAATTIGWPVSKPAIKVSSVNEFYLSNRPTVEEEFSSRK